MNKSADNPSIFIYEVNLTIEINTFLKHEPWLIDHFHQMVVDNNFIKLDLFYVKNVDPINDEHLRYKKITAQYHIMNYEILEKYFEKQAKKMRSQVTEKLETHYHVSRRVLELTETFNNENTNDVT